LQIKLLGAKTTPPPVRSSNAEAFNAYLQGRYFLLGRRTRGTLAKAVSYFEQAVNLDPGYAQAWVGLGQARSDQAGWAYVPVEEGYRTGREAVERALRLNPNLAEAHAVLGSIRMSHDWDWAGADESFKRALALEPGNPIVVSGAGSLAWILGRLDEAIGLYRKAIEIDPLNANLYYYIGVVLHYAGRQEEAMSALNKALELAPEMEFAHALLCRVSLAQGHLQEALAEAVKEKDPAFRLWGLALACHALGRKKESDANLAELISKFQTDDPYQIAGVYAFRGEKDEAFKWLDRARNERDPGMIEMKGDPLLKNLEQSPRYPELLAKMRLPR
jgi:tetratricopeptide (TPR) repeat protein